jgi:deoxyribose-phosphate aldolase
MRKHSPANVQVKAAGGVRDLDSLLKVRELGVTRCGASRTQEILDEANRRLGRPAVQATHVVAVAGY